MPRARLMSHRLCTAAACVGAFGIASPALADDDGQLWTTVLAQGPVRGDLFLWLEAQGRLTDDFGGGSQIIVRPGIGTRIAPDAHAIAGYAYIRTDPEGGRVSNEHRLWQQIQFAALRGADGSVRLLSRSRLEQRMREGADRTGWRFRQLIRGQIPLAAGRSTFAVVQAEGFVNLNATDWGVRDGIDQLRGFAGVNFPLSPRLRVEPGYLVQHVFRPGRDRTNHVISATLLVRL